MRERSAIVPRQYSQVFSYPWEGVVRVGVITDRAGLKVMNRHAYRGRKPTPLGNLAVPFMRAALVTLVGEDQAHTPRIRPATGILWSGGPAGGYYAEGFRQPLWVVPTRHPKALEAALGPLAPTADRIRGPRDLEFGRATGVGDWFAEG